MTTTQNAFLRAPLHDNDIQVALIVKAIFERRGNALALLDVPLPELYIERTKCLGFTLGGTDFKNYRATKKGEEFYKYLKNTGTYHVQITEALKKYLARK